MESATLHRSTGAGMPCALSAAREHVGGRNCPPGFRTTKERLASPLHHDVTQNSAGDSRDISESVPSLLA